VLAGSPERDRVRRLRGVALAIVGVAGVLAFSVSGRTREFGIRLAIGSQPREILTGVLGEGLWMAGSVWRGRGQVRAGAAGGQLPRPQLPGVLPVIVSAAVNGGRRRRITSACRARRACQACRRSASDYFFTLNEPSSKRSR
jgi:hypothetical protein